MFAPMMASPVTTPRYRVTGRPSITLVVLINMSARLQSDPASSRGYTVLLSFASPGSLRGGALNFPGNRNVQRPVGDVHMRRFVVGIGVVACISGPVMG